MGRPLATAPSNPERVRQIAVLVLRRGLKYTEAAPVVGIHPSAVRTTVTAWRAWMQAELDSGRCDAPGAP